MTSGHGGAPRSVVAFIKDRVASWEQGTAQGQWYVLAGLGIVSAVLFGLSFLTPVTLPVSVYAVPLVVGGLALRTGPLACLVGVVLLFLAGSLTLTSRHTSWAFQQAVNFSLVVIVAVLVLFLAARNRSGLMGRLGESMLMELNQRLRVQGSVPPLPAGWAAESVLRSAGGAQFAGDFLIAHLHEDVDVLEVVLVDVSGKGVVAGTKSLQFAGALGGLIGTMPPIELFEAANDFLLRQGWDFSFATAVDLRVDLGTGAFLITNAGHPPVLTWNRVWSTWDLDTAEGMALGIVKDPTFRQSKGVIAPGEAVMMYTDGLVESRDRDVDEGVEYIRTAAAGSVRDGFGGAAARIADLIEGDDDDRAIFILHRSRS
ncbi:MAG TPA: PP2C family protein-serine/threonine phosphatase [Aeromicrobium sp.]|nr:PP2C family protein-serine/threonine phosphatase [Aeromicrobium sp.]